jgi:hypothetical protein
MTSRTSFLLCAFLALQTGVSSLMQAEEGQVSCGMFSLIEQSDLKKDLRICILPSRVRTNGIVMIPADQAADTNLQYVLLLPDSFVPLQPIEKNQPTASTDDLQTSWDEGTATPAMFFKPSKEFLKPVGRTADGYFVAFGANISDHIKWEAAEKIPISKGRVPPSFTHITQSKQSFVKAYRVKGIEDTFWLGSSEDTKAELDSETRTRPSHSMVKAVSVAGHDSIVLDNKDVSCLTEIDELLGSFTVYSSSKSELWLFFNGAGCKYGNPTYVWLPYARDHRASADRIGTFVYAGD